MFRIAVGIAVVLFGGWFLYLGLSEGIGAMIPGVVFALIGVAILLNKKEDDIEEINENITRTNEEHHE